MYKFIFSFLFLITLTSVCFAQWVEQNSGTSKRLKYCYFLNSEQGWVAGHDGTILKTIDGGSSWVAQSIGTLDDVHSIHFNDPLNGWAVLYEFVPDRHGSIIHTTDGGNSWSVQYSIWGYTFHFIHFSDENNGWVTGSNGIIFHTTDAGATWIQQFPNTQGGWLWPIFFIDNNIGWTAGDALFGMFKTTDGGFSWSSTSLPVVESVYSIIFVDTQIGWLCGAQGQIAKSSDGGITWENVQSGSSQFLRDIFFLDYNKGWCVGNNGTIVYSIDGGNNWNDQSSGTSSQLFSVQFIDDQTGWIVGDNGVILKTNNGGIPVELVSFTASQSNDQIQLSWITATELNNQGFDIERKTADDWEIIGFVNGNGTTTEMQYYSFTDNIRLVNNVDRIYYRLKQIDFDGTFEYSKVVEVDLMKPNSYLLQQNYPNPFNPSTKISFTIPETGYATLDIYDVLGNKVKNLVGGNKSPGVYDVEFNATDLSSGIYYYKLVAGDFVDVKKMIFLK